MSTELSKKKKKILVYPCDTEIGLEVYRSLCYAKDYDLWGGSDSSGHGRFVYKNHIDGLPFINDQSNATDIERFNDCIAVHQFDYIYPVMDGVLTVFSMYREHLTPVVIAPEYKTCSITRSKRKTYTALAGIIPIPAIYNSKKEIKKFPCFVKPDCGQGSVGTKLIQSEADANFIEWNKELCMEFLPGSEFTIDCFTNQAGGLIYAGGRKRNRIKGGISVNTTIYDNPLFEEYGKKINQILGMKGGWFFQMREDENGELKLLEVSSRIAGTSAISRCMGINLPLLTMDIYSGITINDLVRNPISIELDRALYNSYKTDIKFDTAYIDYDDTIMCDGKVNLQVIKFIFYCRNNEKNVVLISHHKGNLDDELKQNGLFGVFDKIIHLDDNMLKKDYIENNCAVFIDDSYGERQQIFSSFGIPVFDTHMIECLMEE